MMRECGDIVNDTQLDKALTSEQPLVRLREVIRTWLEQGHDREAILDYLEQFRKTLQASDRDADEDVVLEVMDFLVGWSSPHAKL